MSFDRPQYAREIRYALVDPFAVCEKLGLLAGKGSFSRQAGGVLVRCPWHDDRTPSCSVRRGGDGTLAVRCHGCGVGGDALSLVAAVHHLSTKRDFRRVLIAAADLAGLHGIVRELETGESVPRAKPVAPTPPPADARDYPSAAEVSALWSCATPVTADPEASAWLAGRALDAERVAAHDLARAIPTGASLPRWARYRGTAWTETGHRLLFPMRDPSGIVRTVRAGRLTDGDSPKRLPPGGHKASGVVLACSLGAGMLTGTYSPKRILVVEGEPDFLTAATWSMREPTAVLGLVSGSWTPAHAMRVPFGTTVFVWTHLDEAGDRYAAEVRQTLQRARGCRLFRWSPKEAA
jgi:hypothetical protein